MRVMRRSNVEFRRILHNGKPQDYSNESLVIPLSNLSKTVSHGRKRGGGWGGGVFGSKKYFLITLTLWNNKPFVQTTSADHTGGSVLGFCILFLLANKGLTSNNRIRRCAKRVEKEGCGAITTFQKNKIQPSSGGGRHLVCIIQSIK